MKELWRFNGTRLQVLHLGPDGKYVERLTSLAFPFLPIEGFAKFVLRRREKDQLNVLREFRGWVNSLAA